MSASHNSRKGSKHAHSHIECWSSRPTHYVMYGLGQTHPKGEAKRDTHRFERRIAKAEIKESIHA